MIEFQNVISKGFSLKGVDEDKTIFCQLPKSQRMKVVPNKLLGIITKVSKEGRLDKRDTLLFNTYYNTLVGSREIDINKLFGKKFDRKRTSSTSFTRARLRDKRVRWADQNKNKSKSNSFTESTGLKKLSRLIYGEQSNSRTYQRKINSPQHDKIPDLSVNPLPKCVTHLQKRCGQEIKEEDGGRVVKRFQKVMITGRGRKESIEPRDVKTSESPRMAYLSQRSSSHGYLGAKKMEINANYHLSRVGEPNLKGVFMNSQKPFRHPLIKVQKPSKEEIEKSKLRQVEHSNSQYDDRAALYKTEKKHQHLNDFRDFVFKKKLFIKRSNNFSVQQRERRRHIVLRKTMSSTSRDRKILEINDSDLIS
ncbi:unnamed protein product [Moneuplotes crassus]|uniref:Uncharacterized protein n=1 Tax=Euplotes crassus TaxID=5936 RepID=A0AAD1X932_EUPCR|nr:unnamed protein product [Moneuplotes crassus]